MLFIYVAGMVLILTGACIFASGTINIIRIVLSRGEFYFTKNENKSVFLPCFIGMLIILAGALLLWTIQ